MLETQAPAGAKSQDCLTLRVRSRSGLNRTVKVRTRRLTIGSSEDCNLRLRSAGVEDLHCEIRRSGDGVTAHRLSPQTLLNGEEFEEAKLAAGDTLRVGPMEVTVVQTGVADPWEAAAPAFLPEASSMPPSPAHREKEAESGEARSSPAGKTPGPPPCGEARSAPPANRLDALEELCSALQKDQAHVRGQLAQLEAYAALLESQVEALNAQPEKAEAAVGIAESPQPTPQEIQRGLVERLDAVSLSLADVDDKRKAMEEQWESCLKGLRALAQGQSDYREDVNRRLEEIRGQTQLDADARAAWRQESQERIGDWKGLSQRVEAQLERLRQAEAGLAELGGQVRSEVQESRGFWQQRREEWESWLKAAGAERQEGQAQLAALKQAMARCEESVGERCRQTDGALEELRTQQAGLLEERARCQAEERRLAEMLDALAGTAGGADSAEAPGAGAACEPEPREVPSAEAGMPDAAEVVAAAESEPATDELAHSSVVSPDTPGLAGAGSEDVESEELRRQIREAFGLPLEAVEPADGGELDEAGAGALDAPPAMDEGTGLPAEGPPEPLAATAEEGVRWKSLGDAPEATTSGAATGAAAVHEPPLEGEGHDESIESYMSRLLERVRTSQDDNAAKAGSGETRAAEARPAAETPPTPAPVPPDAERYRPRATAPEMSADIAAMRDLANKNARQAIDTHAKGRLKAQARMKLGLTVVMLLAAVGVTWFLGSMGTAAYLVAVGCLIGAVIFGVQYLVLVSKITAREEEEEEEQAAKPPAPTGGSVESPAAKSPGGAQAPPVEA